MLLSLKIVRLLLISLRPDKSHFLSGFPDHYLNHAFIGKRIIGGVKQKFRVEYLPPQDFIATEHFPSNVTACIYGEIFIQDKEFGEIQIGHLCHIVIEQGIGQNELVSRMWLGAIHKSESGFPPPSVVNYVANTAMYRYFSMPYSWARNQWTHLLEEMGCIGNVLTSFYGPETTRLSDKASHKMDGCEGEGGGEDRGGQDTAVQLTLPPPRPHRINPPSTLVAKASTYNADLSASLDDDSTGDRKRVTGIAIATSTHSAQGNEDEDGGKSDDGSNSDNDHYTRNAAPVISHTPSKPLSRVGVGI
jgi:hypothetical protein